MTMLSNEALKQMLCSNTIAIKTQDGELTYKDLLNHSISLAKTFDVTISKKSAKICVLTDRKLEFIISIVSALIAGHLYTIIDSNDQDSIPEKLENYDYDLIVDLSCVLQKSEHNGKPVISSYSFIHATELDIDYFSGRVDQSGYILYTSGSTGKPKAVHVTYSNIMHYVDGIKIPFSLPWSLSYAHVSSIEADLGNTSIFLSIATFGTLHLISHDLRTDPIQLYHYLLNQAVDVLKITPSHLMAIFNAIPRNNSSSSLLRYLICGGERFYVSFAKELLDSGFSEKIYNHYGPTETTIGVLVQPVDHSYIEYKNDNDVIPIGRPFGNTSILVETDRGYFSKACHGELLIGGPSVSQGYINNEEQNQKSFVNIDGVNYYRSGDIVDVDQEGAVTFLHRRDNQVKIDGYRIELSQLEEQICKVDMVSAVYMMAHEVNKRNLLLCAVQTAVTDIAALRNEISMCLHKRYLPKIIHPLDSFPLNANGKIDTKTLKKILINQLHNNNEHNLIDELPDDHASIFKIWCKYVYNETTEINADFYHLGGDSISAIQFVSELQRNGYNVSASAFMNNPTLQGIFEQIESASNMEAATGETEQKWAIQTPIVKWFFEKIDSDPNYWNQSFLFESEKPLDGNLLQQTLSIIGKSHPSLSSKFIHENGQYVLVHKKTPGYFYTSTRYVTADNSEIAKAIYYTSLYLNESIDIARGNIFRMHHFQFMDKDVLLFICHHLYVDAISWKVILAEFVDVYDQLYKGKTISLPAERTSYGAWSDSLIKNANLYINKTNYWNFLEKKKYRINNKSQINVEGSSSTYWLGLSEKITALLSDISFDGTAIKYDRILLALTLNACSSLIDIESTDIYLESHGRHCPDESMDISRTIGWFTSMFPIKPVSGVSSIQDLAKLLEENISSVPDLGIPFGFIPGSDIHNYSKTNFCYNFLSDQDEFTGEFLCLRDSGYITAPSRGLANPRIFDIKCTVKLAQGCTYIALEIPDYLASDRQFSLINENISDAIAVLTGDIVAERDIVTCYCNEQAIGKMNYIPTPIRMTKYDPHSVGQKNYKNVLVTGATGYVGIYFLRELLRNTRINAICLVRGIDDQDSWNRLNDSYYKYFNEDLSNYLDRVFVYASDLSMPNFSLNENTYSDLLMQSDAVYHFAADTRLFNTAEASYEANVRSTENIIIFCKSGTNKDLHFSSTLAISGVIHGDSEILFSEKSFDVGQIFQNSYEETKFISEKLVRKYGDEGGAIKIYRFGNVTADLAGSKFQKNSADNRLVQMIKGIIKSGIIPSSLPTDIVLTPVDFVAKSMLSISFSDTKEKVFHIDYANSIDFVTIVRVLKNIGYEINYSDEYLNSPSVNDDPDVVLARFWLSRKSKNIKFNNYRTLKILEDKGISEVPLDEIWLTRFFNNLIISGVLPQLNVLSEQV